MSTEAPTAYPVTYDVTPQLTDRNRVTCAFRIILAIPHTLLVGGPGMLAAGVSFGAVSSGGVMGTVALVMAVIIWFVIVFGGQPPKGLRDFIVYYLNWRSKAVAYAALLRDEYPPFGEGAYPVSFDLGAEPTTRDRLSVILRLIYVIPHAVVLFFVGIAWFVTAVIAWFAILLNGAYPEGLYRFAVGYLRWSLRVEAYVLLLHDQYPPFSLE